MNKNRKLVNAFLVSTMILSNVAPVVMAAEEDSSVVRLGGNTRVETSIEVSNEAYDNAKNVVIAGYNGEADALTGTLLASAKEAPLLLVSDKTADVDAIKAELDRLGADNVFLLGEKNAISEEIESALSDYTVKRVAGHDRFDTAAAVANEVAAGKDKKHIFLANDGRSGSLADALAAGPVSGDKQMPVLLTSQNNVPKATLDAIEDLGVEKITIVGGEVAISADVQAQLEDSGLDVDRIDGDTRWETAESIAQTYFEGSEKVVLANDGRSTGKVEIYADALMAGYLGAKENAPILLTVPGTLNEATTRVLQEKTTAFAYILGGTKAISSDVEKEVAEIIAENQVVDVLAEATEAVEKAESSLLDEDFVVAEKLVKALEKSDAKTLLSARLTELKAERQAIVDAVTKALKSGNNIQLFSVLSEAPFTDANSDYIADYRTELEDKETITDIQKAIDKVNKEKLDAELAEVVEAANAALKAVPEYTTANATADKEFTKLAEKAQEAIDALPADYKVNEDDETPLKEKLQTELDGKVQLNNDYVKYVRSINNRANAEEQIRLNSELKAAGIQNVESGTITDYIKVLNDGNFTTLEEIQVAIDLVNAKNAVKELAGDKLTQKNIDAAEAKVNLLPGSVDEEDEENYDATKADLMAKVEEAQKLLTATEAVDALTTTKDDKTVLVADQKAIDVAKKLVEGLEDSAAKTALGTKVESAQDLLNENLVAEVTKEVNALFKLDKDGEIVESKELAKDLTNKDVLDAKKSVADLKTLDADKELETLVNEALLKMADNKAKALTNDDGDLVADKAAIDEAQELVTALPEDVDPAKDKADLQELVDVAYINLAINSEDSTALQNIIVGLNATGFTDLNKAQRNEIGAFMIREAQNDDEYEEFETNADFKTAVEDAITKYSGKINAFNNAANATPVTGEAKATLIAAIKAVTDLEGLSGTQELNLAEGIFNAKPKDGYNVKTVADIEALVAATPYSVR